MSAWHIFAICVSVFLFGRWGAKWVVSQEKQNPQNSAVISGPFLGGIVAMVSFVAMCFFLYEADSALRFFCCSLMAMGLVLVALSDLKINSLKMSLLTVFVCFLSTYFFVPLPLFEVTGIHNIIIHLIMGGVWAVFIWLFVSLDRTVFLSMTISIGFTVFYYLLSSMAFGILPSEMGYLAFILLIVQVGVLSYLKQLKCPVLGRGAALFVGFIWGGLAVYVMGLGYAVPVSILYAYPIMEVVLSTLGGIIFYRQVRPACPFVVEQALAKNIKPDKVLHSVMWWSLLLGVFASLSITNKLGTSVSMFYICTGVILLNIYMRLNAWGDPKPRLRDVWGDTKKGLEEAKTQWNALPWRVFKEKMHVNTHEPNKTDTAKKESVNNPQKHSNTQQKSPKTKRGE